MLSASGERAQCGKLATGSLSLLTPILTMRSDALHVTFERFDLVGRVPWVAVDDRLNPVALNAQRVDALARLIEVERELDVFVLDVLLVGERDSDRWEVWFGASEPLRQRDDRLPARPGSSSWSLDAYRWVCSRARVSAT